MGYRVLRIVMRIIFSIIYRVKVYGLESLDLDQRLIVCGNHWNNLDPLFISAFFPRKIHWMAKKELFKNKHLANFILAMGSFPVDRSKTDISATKTALKYLREDEILGIFPEATRVKKADFKTVKGGTALIALRAKAKVLPVYIEGNFKVFSKMNIYFRDIVELESTSEKLSNEDYEKLTINIMEKVYGIGGND